MTKKIFISGMLIMSMTAFCDFNTPAPERQRGSGYWVSVPISQVVQQGNLSNFIEGATEAEAAEFLRTELMNWALAEIEAERQRMVQTSEEVFGSEVSDDETNDSMIAYDGDDTKSEHRIVENNRKEDGRLIR